jgi:hypothetical protein
MRTAEPDRLTVTLGLVSALALATGNADTSAPLLVLGLALLLGGAAGCLMASRSEKPSRAQGFTVIAIGCLSLGMAAMLASDAVLLGSPLLNGHESLLGIPNHLPWLCLAAAALRLRVAPHDGRARALWALSTGWALATLWMPVHSARGSEFPLFALWESHGWLAIALCLSSLLAVWRMLPWLTPIDVRSSNRCGFFVVGAPACLGLSHLSVLVEPSSSWAARAAIIALLLSFLVLVNLLARALAQLAKNPRPSWFRGRAELLTPAVALGLFLMLKTHGMGASITDENIYFYMASKISEGQWPYVDYFFAHPPLHVVLPGLLFSITGFSLLLAKAIAPLACAVSGGALWSLARTHFGQVAAAIALVSFLFGAEVLKASTNMTGINLTVMWLLLGLWAWSTDRPRRAGLFFAVSLSTGIYAAAAVCAAIALGAFRSRKFMLELLGSTVALFALVNLMGWWLAPDAFLDGVYRYHGLKEADAAGFTPLFGGDVNPVSAWIGNLVLLVEGKPFTKEVFYHAHLWWAGALVPLVALAQCGSEDRPGEALRGLSPHRLWTTGSRGKAALFWWVAVSLFVQFALFRELYSFYFVLIYPLLALCLGWVVEACLELVTSSVSRSWPVRRAALKLGSGALLLTALLGWESLAYDAQTRAFPKEVESIGERVSYTWKPAPVLSSLSPVVRHLFWADHREKGVMERGYRHYLWNKKRALVSLPEIARYIQRHSAPEDTIAGSSTVAPLLALASDRRLAANEADTNSKRFKTGILSEEAYWDAICQDQVRFIVSTSRSFFTPGRMQNHPMIKRWFRAVKRFNDPEIRHGGTYPILLFERTQDQPIDGRVCK